MHHYNALRNYGLTARPAALNFFVHNPKSALRPKEYQYLPQHPTHIIKCSLGCYGSSRSIRGLREVKLSTERTAYSLNMKLQRTFHSDPAAIQTPTVDLWDAVLCNLANMFLGHAGTNLLSYMASRTRSPYSESFVYNLNPSRQHVYPEPGGK